MIDTPTRSAKARAMPLFLDFPTCGPRNMKNAAAPMLAMIAKNANATMISMRGIIR